MKNLVLSIVGILVLSLFLTGCQNTPEISPGTESPVENTEIVHLNPTVTLTPSPSFTPDSTAAQPTRTPTSTPEASPTTPVLPSSTVTPEPTSTSVPPQPEVITFSVSPAEALPGDTITLSWEAKGDRATLCPTARYILFNSDDCWQVPLTGTATFTIPSEAASFQYVEFILTVETAAPAGSVTGQVSVALKCATTWFFSEEPLAGICPRDPTRSYAAAQAFEQGTMIWLEVPGRYYVLQDTPLQGEAERNRLDIISDPLEIERDTSSEIQPPPGLYAPVSGFGLVWRGDVAQSPGFREQLGWALAPEFGYDAILQCDDARPSGGRSWQTCYLAGPEGEIILLHPLGGWELWSQP
jgi:hypothetical protein